MFYGNRHLCSKIAKQPRVQIASEFGIAFYVGEYICRFTKKSIYLYLGLSKMKASFIFIKCKLILNNIDTGCFIEYNKASATFITGSCRLALLSIINCTAKVPNSQWTLPHRSLTETYDTLFSSLLALPANYS